MKTEEMTLEQSFNAALDADASDTTTRLVYADWLEENGFDDIAKGHRFLAREDKYPAYVPEDHLHRGMNGERWRWFNNMWDESPVIGKGALGAAHAYIGRREEGCRIDELVPYWGFTRRELEEALIRVGVYGGWIE